VKNTLFGDSVTVTGLVPGRDIVRTVKEGRFFDVMAVVVPDVMMKEGEGVFIDDMTLKDLYAALGLRVEVFDSTPTGFYRAMQKCLLK
ncbi:MAG TPA: DUF512 domain-containing protein, partial [Geobacteraceae bacterium]|nr:DUF512 domain-containing protein [Geobacteraceae bacterium]